VKRRLFVFATEMEKEGILGSIALPPTDDLLVTGVGIIPTTLNLTKWLYNKKIIEHINYDELWDLGIAGAYPGSGLQIGDVVNVASDFCIEETPVGANHIRPFFDHIPDVPGIPSVSAATVLHCADTHEMATERGKHAKIETMEGAAFFAVAQDFGVPAHQVRSVSNVAGVRDKKEWNTPLALQNLSKWARATLFLLFFCCFAATAAPALSTADLEAAGDSLYNLRSVGAKNDHAPAAHIAASVERYKAAYQKVSEKMLQKNLPATRLAAKILRSYYFWGCFAYKDKDDRLSIFTHAREDGLRMMHDSALARDPEVAYYHVATLALWANDAGPFQAVKEGAAAYIKETAERLIAQANAQGAQDTLALACLYQVLGRTHQLLPRIPLLLPWPDDSVALAALQKSFALNPEDWNTALFLAEYWKKHDQPERARQILENYVRRPARKSQWLEDERTRYKMADALKQ
jgi:hypothetical protein